MLRDASHKQVIQKFSFIQSLNLSRGIARDDQTTLHKIQSDQIVNSQQEKILKSSKSLAPETLATNSPAEVTSESAAIIQTSTIDSNWYESNSDSYSLSLAEIIKYSTPENPTENYTPKNRNYLGKILFALSCSYCVFVSWWLFGHHGSRILTRLTGGQRLTISKSDIEFIDYMERSLDTIDRQLEAKRVNDKDNQVVYIPVYTPTSATPNFPQVSSNNLPVTPLPNQNTAQIPEPIAITQPKSKPVPEVLKIPAPPPLPAPTPLETGTPAQEKLATTITKPSVKHTLIGILELGENKSGALVKMNNQIRRVWLGEEITTNGWVLESVSSQRVRISYQGEVRSIAVGETF